MNREMDRMLREQQDADFAAALAVDSEKERQLEELRMRDHVSFNLNINLNFSTWKFQLENILYSNSWWHLFEPTIFESELTILFQVEFKLK